MVFFVFWTGKAGGRSFQEPGPSCTDVVLLRDVHIDVQFVRATLLTAWQLSLVQYMMFRASDPLALVKENPKLLVSILRIIEREER